MIIEKAMTKIIASAPEFDTSINQSINYRNEESEEEQE